MIYKITYVSIHFKWKKIDESVRERERDGVNIERADLRPVERVVNSDSHVQYASEKSSSRSHRVKSNEKIIYMMKC